MARLVMRGGRIAAVLLLLALAMWPVSAGAHYSRPLFIGITEQGSGLYLVTATAPETVPFSLLSEVALPDRCSRLDGAGPAGTLEITDLNGVFRCVGGLGGQALALVYPDANPSLSTMVSMVWASGESRVAVALPGKTRIALPSPETATGVADGYTRLGIKHILTGFDHLLFLVCIVLIARTKRRILITITGFTIAHSITLSLATLGIVHFPVKVIESLIALSVVFLAAEICRDRRDTLTWRHPIVVSALFGLLHGFGFANALYGIGLPQTEIPVALLFFNLGVEIGQLIFVGLVMALLAAGRRLLSKAGPIADAMTWSLHAERALAYGVGSVASFWMIDRIYGFI